ncbi:MAG: DNA primase, partial [Nitrospirales bacterium]
MRAGQHLKGLCPFHAEKTPSFTVSPSRQMFHCFGCGVGGNVFTFIMKIEGTAFPDAVRELGRRTGIPVPLVTGGSSGPQAALRERLERLNDAAGAYFHRTLVDSDAGRVAREYLAHRGITPATIEAFRIGWAPPAWDGLLRALAPEGFTVEELERAGLVVPKDPNARRAATASSHYDRFRARVMFPIGDLSRRTIGFGGRVLDDGVPKYLNSPETPLFSKGRALFALDRAREPAGRANTVLIVEGYFDAIALHQAGIANAVATLGTALTPDHIRAMRRFASQVVLLFDPDAAGVRAAIRTLDLFADSGMSVRVVSLPDGADPDTFVRTGGPDSFARLVEQATTLLDFAVEHSLQSAASGGIEDRIRSVD